MFNKIILSLLLLFIPFSVFAKGNEKDFLDAEKHLENNNLADYQKLKQTLTGYPLLPYLEYAELKKRKSPATQKDLDSFIRHWPLSGPTALVRNKILNQFAAKNDWARFLKYYDPKDKSPTRRCHYLNALIKQGQLDKTHQYFDEVWLTSRSLPRSCNPVFSAWKKHGVLNSKRVWERAYMTLSRGKPKLTQHLKRYLASNDQKLLDQFIALRKNPRAILKMLKKPFPSRGEIFGYALRRLGNRNAVKAVDLWEELLSKTTLTSKENCLVNEKLAKGISRKPGKRVYSFFLRAKHCPESELWNEKRVLAGLLRQDWSQVYQWIEQMTDEQKKQEPWRYWLARAAEQTGKKQQTRKLYLGLLKNRSFYAYLASDRLGRRYYHNHRPTSASRTLINHFKNHPSFKRIVELSKLGRITSLNREWNLLQKELKDEDEFRAFALLLYHQDILDRAIFTLVKSDFWDDLDLRFPLRHEELVKKYATKRQIDPSWVFATIRQESAFQEQVKSSANAYGLMQLLHGTARKVAKRYKEPSPGITDLYQPETNISLGTGYLTMMMDKFGNHAMASAAYNAGPHRVLRWQFNFELPGDIWVELIPFTETRDYVKRVMTYASIYDRRLKRKGAKISTRVGKVPPKK